MLEYALVEGFSPNVEFGEEVWLEALPARNYHTPQYGEVPILPDTLERMVKNFKENVRGQEVAVNFDHGMDRAKGSKAAGWFTDFDVLPSSDDPEQLSLHAKVKFTDEAEQEIKNGGWKYFSLEWDNEWLDNAGQTHKDVIVGGAVTNRPVAKNMATLPVNFSEALWNELTDEEQKKFPVKMSEEVADAIAVLDREGYEYNNESKEWEHSEPGTGSPPVPRKDEDGSDDRAITERWRRDPLPLDPNDPGAPSPNKGEGVLTEEELAKVREALGLKADATADDIVTAAETAFSESKKFSEALSLADEDKRFSEQYPNRWAEHQKMLVESRENNAVRFSESVKQFSRPEGEKLVPTDKGLSALALDKVKEVHKKFSEGTASVADFEDAVKTIVNGGLVDFSEQGTSRESETIEFSTSTAEGIKNARVLFAEKVAQIQEQDQLDMKAALTEAAKRYPDLAQAYRAAAPA